MLPYVQHKLLKEHSHPLGCQDLSDGGPEEDPADLHVPHVLMYRVVQPLEARNPICPYGVENEKLLLMSSSMSCQATEECK